MIKQESVVKRKNRGQGEMREQRERRLQREFREQRGLKEFNYPLKLKPHSVSEKPQSDKNYLDSPVPPFHLIESQDNKNLPAEKLLVYEMKEYANLELVLANKLRMLQESIDISKQKNKLKDRQILTYVGVIDKQCEKIKKLEVILTKKEEKLSKISLKCHSITELISKQQDTIKRQQIFLHEQTSKCKNLEQKILIIQQNIHEAQRQLIRRKKICDSLDSLEDEGNRLRERVSQLSNEQKMLQYHQSNDNKQCSNLEKRIKEVNNVIKQRNQINQKNNQKLKNLKREVEKIQKNNTNLAISGEQIKSLEFQIGELNQELLLLNEDISQLQFKIKKKGKNIQQLRQILTTKINFNQEGNLLNLKNNDQRKGKKEVYKIIESEEDELKSRPQNKSPSRSIQNSARNFGIQSASQSRNASPVRNRGHQTPTFPSHQQNINSQPMRNIKLVDEHAPENEANKNIQKLIQRYESLRSREKSR